MRDWLDLLAEYRREAPQHARYSPMQGAWNWPKRRAKPLVQSSSTCAPETTSKAPSRRKVSRSTST